jgi:hypothetical protein
MTGAFQLFVNSVLLNINELARIFRNQLSLEEIMPLELEVRLLVIVSIVLLTLKKMVSLALFSPNSLRRRYIRGEHE